MTLLPLTLAIAAASLGAAPPARNVLSVSSTSVAEGNSGVRYAAVTVTLASPSGRKTVSVDYRTSAGTATVGGDYDAVSGTLTFAPGQTSKTVHIPVRGDRIGENTYYSWNYGPPPPSGSFGNHASEYFYVKLSNPKDGTLGYYGDTAAVYILDDEPRLDVWGANFYEGNSGTTPFTFSLSLSAACDEAVTVDFETQDYTAFAGIDYVAASGTITFAPGETYKTFTVDVIGNTVAEPDKSFSVNLDLVNGAPSVALAETSVYGTIVDDDGYYDDYYEYWAPDYYYGW
ncbi:hypothetical protein AYO49_00915 [Verrucomicrobiaceae bacterium SCGC AG-212-N21]|nr:hypothetical protein AYO49_00915 [Verrucomicrobiaceae bacterium SCGC AG-212-N21]